MRKTTFLFLVLALCLSSILPSSSYAQARRTTGAVIRLQDFKIVGRIQKPQAFYVLHRAPLNYESLEVKESFVKKVIQAVRKNPF